MGRGGVTLIWLAANTRGGEGAVVGCTGPDVSIGSGGCTGCADGLAGGGVNLQLGFYVHHWSPVHRVLFISLEKTQNMYMYIPTYINIIRMCKYAKTNNF